MNPPDFPMRQMMMKRQMTDLIHQSEWRCLGASIVMAAIGAAIFATLGYQALHWDGGQYGPFVILGVLITLVMQVGAALQSAEFQRNHLSAVTHYRGENDPRKGLQRRVSDHETQMYLKRDLAIGIGFQALFYMAWVPLGWKLLWLFVLACAVGVAVAMAISLKNNDVQVQNFLVS